MLTEGTGDFLERLDAGSHGLAAPLVEKLAGPARRVVVPELLKGFLEEIGTDRFQFVAQEIAEPQVLFDAEVIAATEQQPSRLPEHHVAALPLQTTGFLGADFIQRLVHVRNDMKTVEDV